jgi:hypothetical protein
MVFCIFATNFIKMKKLIILFGAIMTIVACSSNDASETSIDGNNYNKVLFGNWADNIIIPSYVSTSNSDTGYKRSSF